MKKITSSLLTGLTLLSFATPVLAQESTETNTQVGTTSMESTENGEHQAMGNGMGFICNTTKLQEMEQKRMKKFTENDANREKMRNENDPKLKGRRAELEAKMANHRANRDGKVIDNPQVKIILDTFRASIDAALAVRKSAVDGLGTTYRAKIDAAVAARKASMEAAFNTLKATVCPSTTPTTEVTKEAKVAAVNAYRDAMKAAQITFTAAKKAAMEVGKPGIEAAQQTFKTAVAAAEKVKKDALAALRATMPAPTTTNMPVPGSNTEETVVTPS